MKVSKVNLSITFVSRFKIWNLNIYEKLKNFQQFLKNRAIIVWLGMK